MGSNGEISSSKEGLVYDENNERLHAIMYALEGWWTYKRGYTCRYDGAPCRYMSEVEAVGRSLGRVTEIRQVNNLYRPSDDLRRMGNNGSSPYAQWARRILQRIDQEIYSLAVEGFRVREYGY